MRADINPDNKCHRALQADVAAFLRGLGFVLADLTYHKALDVVTQSLFKKSRDRTILGVRGRADFTAYHPGVDWGFHVDVKTIDHWPNLAVEALPYVCHRLDSYAGVPCLYVARDFNLTRPRVEFGFTAAGPLPPLTTLFYTDRDADMVAQIAPVLTEGVRCAKRGGTNGSNDPYLLVRAEDFGLLRIDWGPPWSGPAAVALKNGDLNWRAAVLSELARRRANRNGGPGEPP